MEIEVRYGWDYAVNGDPCKYARLVLVDEGGREISSLDLGEITAAIKFIGVKVMDDTTELAAKLADAERVARYESDIAQQALDQMRAAEAALPAVYRLALEDAYWSREVTPTPTAAELMARIQTGEK